MPRRFQFNMRALLLLVVVAAIYTFIASLLRDDRSGAMTESDRIYLEREKESARRESLERLKKQENRGL